MLCVSWGHPELLAKSDEWFVERLENATFNTALQGYQGTRWGKMLGVSGKTRLIHAVAEFKSMQRFATGEANMWGLGKGDGTKRIMYGLLVNPVCASSQHL